MKIIPGQPILQLHVERNSPYDDQPSSAKRIRKENIHPKKSNKKRKTHKKFITDDDEWIFADCGEVWDDYGDCRQITCNIFSSNYHLECSEIQYPTEHYWNTDFYSRKFECPDCVAYFQSDQPLKKCSCKTFFFPIYLHFVMFFYRLGCFVSAFCMFHAKYLKS